MDNKWLKDLKSKVANYESSKKYQDYCWKVYRKNEVFIKEFIKWRTLFNIKPKSTADKALAFFIHKIWQEHGFRWKGIIYNFMVAAMSHPPGMFTTYLSVYLNKYKMGMVEELLAGKMNKHYVSKDRVYSKDYLTRWLQNLKNLDKNSLKILKQKKIIALSSPPIEFLPEWYFIARPTNKFYQDENLEAIIKPLIEKEIAEDNIKFKYINKLNELLNKHAFKTMHSKKAIEYLKSVAGLVSTEMEFRKKIKDEDGLKKVKELEEDIETQIIGQKILLKKIKEKLSMRNEHSIMNKEVHEKVQSLLNKIETIIKKELK
jgi:hypothetical protein